MLRPLRRLVALSTAERWLLLRAFAALIATDLALHTSSFHGLIARARNAGAPRQHASNREELLRAMAYAHWLEVASRYHLVRARCLHRSITLHSWLLREGLSSELKLGVRKEGDELKAHAWVELDGTVVSDEPGSITQFKPLTSQALQW
jgi:hypothetical protein